MNATAVIAVAIGATILLGALAFMTLARRSDVRGAGALSSETKRRDTAARSTQLPVSATRTGAEAEAEGAVARAGVALAPINTDTGITPWIAPDADAIGVTRRVFFNRALISLMAAGLGTFAAASFVAFLWPTKTGGFGGKVPVGRLSDIQAGITAGNGFFYAPEARAWITTYPADSLPKAEATYQPALLPGLEAGIIVSYQKCPHLGCRVPQCATSQWFECGCHGSQYNRVGEKKGGPAPRGMDHFAPTIAASGDVIIDTGTVWQGRPIGVNTTGQEAEGPHCVGAAEH